MAILLNVAVSNARQTARGNRGSGYGARGKGVEMVARVPAERSQGWLRWFPAAALVGVVSLAASVDMVFAQELGEKEKQLALVQYTLPYRFDKNLKVGDWVKYQIVEEGEEKQEIELKVTKKEKGGVWIVEKQTKGRKPTGMEMHLLVNLKNLSLVKALGVDAKGRKQEAAPLGEKKLSQAIEIGKKEIEKQSGEAAIVGWEKGSDAETIKVAAGSFSCDYLEPIFSEAHEEQAQKYGMSVADLKKKSRVYFSEDVPRLLPLMMAGGWIQFIEVFGEVKGGMVKLPHLSVQLVAYSGQE